MNEQEDYFRVAKKADVHILSNRIPFKWKELMIWTSASFVFLLIWTGWLAALLITILTSVGYMFYRFAAYIFYSELKIDEKSGKTKHLMSYRTHKNNELLILRSRLDKESVQKYILEKISGT